MDASLETVVGSIAHDLRIDREQVGRVLELLDAGNTIPFITRYRKDQTGGLDEQHIHQIKERANQHRALQERKATILKSIASQDKLTDELSESINAAASSKALEDIYLPFKPKKQTLATQARQRGLAPLAQDVLNGLGSDAELASRALEFVRVDKGLNHVDDVMLGVQHLFAEEFSERADLRRRLREIIWKDGKLASSRAEPPESVKEGDKASKTSRETKKEPTSGEQGAEPLKPAPNQDDTEAGTPAPTAVPEPSPSEANPVASQVDSIDTPANKDEAVSEANVPDDAVAAISVETAQSETAQPSTEPADAAPSISAQADEGQGGEGQSSAEVAAAEPASAESPEQETRETDSSPAGSVSREEDNPTLVAEATPPDSKVADEPSSSIEPSEVPSSAPAGTTDEQPVSAAPTSEPPAQDASVDTPVASETPNVETAPTDPPAEVASPAEAAAESSQAGGPAAKPASEADTKGSKPATKEGGKGAQPARKDSKKAAGKGKAKKEKKEKRDPFETYFDFQELVSKIPPHRVLAINRGERAKTLKVRIDTDFDAHFEVAKQLLLPESHPHLDFLTQCVRDSLQRLVLPALEREIRRELTERAERHAVEVFARNLRKLLLQRPVDGQKVLALDPGFKSGCQIAILDEFGNLCAHNRIFIVGNEKRLDQARKRLADLIRENGVTAIAIGNGAACRQTEKLVAEVLEKDFSDGQIAYVIVNEAGASVYSTSSVGREELPELDAKVRSAVSIGRRLLDPLSELVKISPANIGVGMYQHDVKAKHLQESLDDVVASSVNFVGVDVNTASPSLLKYVSGLNQLTARRIVEYRKEHGPLKTREQLKEVQGVGDATFVQAAGFLRVANGDEPIDATWIHPESYELARALLQRVGVSDPRDVAGNDPPPEGATRANPFESLDLDELSKELGTGRMLLQDIVNDLRRPGRDPREDLPAPIFRRGIVKFEDLTSGMALNGRVLNVVDFGVFVDIGLSDSGLVHISKLSDRFVDDPHDVASVGDLIHVWVLDVDKARRRVSLTAIDPSRPVSTPNRPSTGKKKPARRRPKPAGKGGDSNRQGGKSSSRVDRKRFQRKPPKPKPVKPISSAMVEGRKPMRSFSDLKQFFDINKDEPKKPEE